jgi:TAG lipase/steryl ester hydrolase/phospholipase A2/LPA acyltransferase
VIRDTTIDLRAKNATATGALCVLAPPPPEPPSDDGYAPRGDRPKLQLKPRSEAAPTSASAGSSSLFGGAKPVDVKYVEDKPREAIPIRSEENPERTERKQYDEPKDSDGDRWGRKSSFAPRKEEELREATPEERAARPKLNLQKRSTDAPVGAAAKSSLFGGARPREEALKEAGRDWQAEDLKRSVGAVKRKEFKEEKELKEKIQAAKDAGDDVKDLELELTKLSLELDDKFRFAKGRPEPKDGKDGKSKDTPAPKDKPAAAEKSAPAPRERAAPAPKLAEPAPVVARNAFDALADSMNS